jgi:hypothetical protein
MKKLLLFLCLCNCLLKGQVFTYHASSTLMMGTPGDVFYCNITFSNPSSTSVTVIFDRYQKNNPPYWYSCFCFVQCNPPSLDYLQFDLAANSSSVLGVMFKTDSINPGTATASIRIYEAGFAANADTIYLNASTVATGLTNRSSMNSAVVFPNPAQNEFTFVPSSNTSYRLILSDQNGNILIDQKNSEKKQTLNLEQLPKGNYFLRTIYDSGKLETKKIIKN